MHRERGFSLVELLVVVLIISILAAVAIPSLLQRRFTAFEADVRTSLRNAAIAAAGYSSDNGGSFAGLTPERLEDEGLRLGDTQEIDVPTAAQSVFCIELVDDRLDGRPPWDIAHFDSSANGPQPGGC